MFVPLKDDTPHKVIRFQFVTAVLVALNVAIFLVTGPLFGTEAAIGIAEGYGVVPVELLTVTGRGGSSLVAEPVTLITYQFLHGGWLHLLSNMAFLWVFADNIEDAFGRFGFALFYVLCGIFAALVHALMSPTSAAPLIGASGAVSGVLGSYLLLYPKARIWVLVFMAFPMKLPALWILAAWIVFQFYSLFMATPDGLAVAWWAHIGGFISGFFLTLVLRSRLLVNG